VGRAPWLVYGIMRHSESVTPSLTGGMALFTLIGYVVVYALVFASGVYYLMRVLYVGLENDDEDETDSAERPARPISAAHVPFEYDNHGRIEPADNGGQ
jgi:cytochrome d ubiquinol oxidase subunit I